MVFMFRFLRWLIFREILATFQRLFFFDILLYSSCDQPLPESGFVVPGACTICLIFLCWMVDLVILLNIMFTYTIN